jgi:aspartyl-tRNA(Asn)/glutamyl-tRNA(Gln) amidotransferase subunit A
VHESPEHLRRYLGVLFQSATQDQSKGDIMASTTLRHQSSRQGESAHYYYSTISQLSELVRHQQVSPVELVRKCLQRIEMLNPKLNAFITVTGDEALEQAHKAEAEINNAQWKGPLHGIPIGVKDFFDTAAVKTTGAFEHFRNRIPRKDAEVVKKLKEAGAVIVGKTNMHTLGMGTTSVESCFGPVHNPWNSEFVAGGSSGGSAAAIAAGMCYATVDTDAIGSCRLPAACCGVTGFKPTFGLISTQGILEGEPVDDETARTIAAIGHTAITCRAAADLANVLNVVATPGIGHGEFRADYLAALANVKRPKVGVANNYKATREVRSAFQEVVEVLRSLGFETVDIEISFASATFNLATIEQDRETISRSLFKDVEVLVLPTTTDVPPRIEQVKKSANPQAVSPDNTFFCNYYGLPAVSVPCGFNRTGLPLGFQIVGPQWSEDVVLNMAHSFSQTANGAPIYPLP